MNNLALQAPQLDYTGEQLDAINMAVELAKTTDQVGVLNGAAGTGKTTSLQAIRTALGGKILMLCPTGRAASVARKLSGGSVHTIHHVLYHPDEDEETGDVTFLKKHLNEIEEAFATCRLVVVDEASMIGRDVWNHVLDTCQRMGRSVLLVGDGHQLPPVEMDPTKEPFSVFAPAFLKHQAHQQVTLTEVQRQALESPILRVATEIRHAQSYNMAIKALRTLPRVPGSILDRAAGLCKDGADHVVITHRNATRLSLNKLIRKRVGHTSPEPEASEPLLIRRNSYPLNLWNGEVHPFPGWRDGDNRQLYYEKHRFKMTTFNGYQRTILCPVAMLEGDTKEPLPGDLRCMKQRFGLTKTPYLRANLGYCLTTHNAQGSEWKHVILIVEESLFAMPEPERIRWTYTAVTRAREVLEVAIP